MRVASVSLDWLHNMMITTGLIIKASEDAYLGDAEFSVYVDGVKVGNDLVVTASHNLGQQQTFNLGDSFSTGRNHTVEVRFLNDTWGGMTTSDRNLYITSISLGNVSENVDAAFYENGSRSFPLNSKLINDGSGKLKFVGVNLSGAEFSAAVVPGKLNYDYTFPTTSEIDSYASVGLNFIRLPFLWERLQPIQGGPIDQDYLSNMDKVVSYATARGLRVDLDMHDQGFGYGNVIGVAARQPPLSRQSGDYSLHII